MATKFQTIPFKLKFKNTSLQILIKTISLKKSRLFQDNDKVLKKAQLMKVVKKSIVHILIAQRSLKLSSLKDMKSKSKKTKTSMLQNG